MRWYSTCPPKDMSARYRSHKPEGKLEWDHEALLLIILFFLVTLFGPMVN